MSEVTSKIPIGFGLEGYTIKSSGTEGGVITATSGGVSLSGGADGVAVGWSNAELDNDRWVKDKSLKQVVVQTTCFQSAPLRYNDNGKITYLNLRDGIDKWSYLPGGAWGATLGCVLTSDLKAVKEMQTQLNGADMDAGFAFCPYTLVHYLNWFYGIKTNWEAVNELCRKRLLCAEMHINCGGSNGKAVRLKISSSAGRKGDKGSNCSNGSKGGTHIAAYDKFDINVSVLLTKGYSDIVDLKSNKLGPINNGTLDFPWKDNYYDYRTGKIPGYNPNEMINWTDNKFGTLDIPVVSSVRWRSSVNGHTGLPLSRVRFFVEPENLAAAQAIIPGLTEEFTKTNYGEGETSTFEVIGTAEAGMDSILGKPVVVSQVQYKHNVIGQSSVRSEKSDFGRHNTQSDLVLVELPGPIRNRKGDPDAKHVYCHRLVADRLEAILKDVVNHYGDKLETVAPLLTQITSSYRSSKVGSSQSIHNWGLAFDFDADSKEGFAYSDVGIGTTKRTADGKQRQILGKPTLANPEYDAFWQIVKAHGAYSLGKDSATRTDWMHIQFASFG